MVQQSRKIRRRLRMFIITWTFLTLVMGLATFMAIYFTYRSPINDDGSGLNLALVLSSNTADNNNNTAPPTNDEVVQLPSITPQPTQNVVPTATATTQAIAQMASPTEQIVETVIVATNTPQPLPTRTPTPLPVDDKRFQVGIQVQYSLDFNPENQRGLYHSVADTLGLNWVKQQVRWEDFERQPDQIDYAILDLVMPAAEQEGLKMMLSIVTAPDWARESGVDVSKEGPPANNQEYVDFVTSIVRRYPGQVHAIEVWNEQNLDREWTSTNGLSPENYVALLRDTYNAVKAIDPGIIIVSGALSPTGVDDGVTVINDFRYMELLIDAGMLDYTDCVGAHHNGYNIGPTIQWNSVPPDSNALFRGPFDNPHHSWSFRSTLEGYVTRINRAGYDTPLCVTEFGWAVAEDLEGYPPGFEFAVDNTLDDQAMFFPEALTFMEQMGQVWIAIVWNFNYGPQAGYNPDNDNVPYSLIGPGYRFRPAFDAIAEWQRSYLARGGI